MYVGTGTTIGFDSGFLAEILDVTPPGMSRESIPTSHMATPDNAHTFTPSKLVDYGEMACDIGFDPSEEPPIDEDPETITITFPDSASTEWSFLGFMTGYEPADPLEDRMVASVTVKVSGKVSID